MEASEAEALRQLTQRVCENVSSYVGFQLEGSMEEMALLRRVVEGVDAKYVQIRREAKRLGKLSKVLKSRARGMEEKMKTIDAIDEELADLEDMVEQLDQYTGALQTKFNQVN